MTALRRVGLPAMLCVLLASCAAVPQIDETTSVGDGRLPRVVGANGPLTARQTTALLERLAAEGKSADLLGRHLAVEQSVAETPLVAGNQVHLLEDGPASFHAIFTAIRAAKSHINLEYYILEDVESDGEYLSDLLIGKRNEGVAVNIIYDSYGSIATPGEVFRRLRNAGVNLVAFNPLNPLQAKNGYTPNDRDHRKMLIVDGSVGVIGGVNLSKTYQSHPFALSERSAEEQPQYWHDIDAEIEGPVVAQLRNLFLAHWREQKGPPLDEITFFPKVGMQGHEVVRVIGSTPGQPLPRYYATLLSAIRAAERSIWISAAYFVPTHQEEEDLVNAALRGVDVRLLLPGQSDSELALAVQRSHYGDLMGAGVLVYETRDEILHSKTAVIDGVWSVIGSSNFDHRSVIFNDEVDAVFLGTDTAGQLEAIFRSDTDKAAQVDLGRWRQRPFSERAAEWFARIWQDML